VRRGNAHERRSLALTSLGAKTRARRVAGYVVGIVGVSAMTLSLLPFRDDLQPLSKGFGYLAVVVAAAAVGGLGPGILASVLGFLAFNVFFLPPYNTLAIGRPEYVVVLFVYLGLSVLISALLARATDRAEAAEAREAELRILQELSADLVTSLPGRDTYAHMLHRLIRLFGFDAGSLHFHERLFGEAAEPVTVGTNEPLDPHWDPAAPGRAPERLPLTVGGRTLGLIVLRGDRPPLSPPESRVLRAFCDQMALILEDERLLRAATQAEVYRQTEEVRRSLLAAVSHDLRSPLAAIKASASDLLDRDVTRSPEAEREALLAINDQADRLNALVTNLLDMSRIEAGMLRARTQTIDLDETLTAAVDRVREQRPSLRLRLSIAPDATLVDADPVFFERVISNLLENAVAATTQAGADAFEVDVRRSGDEVVIRVVDHGAGVPANIRELLFYPFYSLERRGARLGTGLGLAICKGLLAVMGGEIWIEDTPGGGATFACSLPLPAKQLQGTGSANAGASG
jgi:two-component system, OmpR family, sensor histidine kinase KdpD